MSKDQHKVINHYIIRTSFGFEVLFETTAEWYISSHGAFGQRDFTISRISEDEAEKLLANKTKPFP